MKKKKYEPRIVIFKGAVSGIYNVDTRIGMDGFYPGDIIDIQQSMKPGERIVVGVCDGILWFTMPEDKGKIHNMCFAFPHHCGEVKLIKRHAQYLIDSGEMIQFEEVNK